MPAYRKRGRVSSGRAVKTSMRVGNWSTLARASRARRAYGARKVAALAGRLQAQIRSIGRSIETKEGQWSSANNIALPHNNITLVLKGDGGPLNPFQSSQGAGDPMDQNQFVRIGDQITVKGMMVKGFFEGALQRSKVYFRVMLVKYARGDAPTRDTLFKNDSNNKMLDVINTERYTVVWQKIFNVSPPNPPPNTVSVTGVAEPGVLAGVTGNRIIRAWIPGRKFGKGGVVQYESSTSTNPKFFDYRFYVLAYDWYGTPQDANNVGRINSMFSKIYFKDA